MAEVYEAVNLNTKRHIALKILLPHLSTDPVIRKRFLREAKVGLELNHPGIAKIYEVGDEQNNPFIAMELIKGNTLDEIMTTEALDISQMLQIMIKITDAIAAAHVKKIIHRDIKPKNIMISGDEIKVMDFGLARIIETSSLTDRFEILGTLYYMSPQQVTGEKLDGRSDIFSLGVVLYQMLTNTLPFSGEHPGTILHAILYSDPLRMSETGRQIPVQIEQVVFKALRKKPNQRYQTVSDLRTDLRNVRESIQGQSVELIATEEVFEETPHGIYTALIGRDSEMKTLEDHVNRMMKAESSAIMVRGEAGIGKSRIIWELGKKAKTMQARYLVGRCLYGEAGSPYQPVIKIIRDYFELKDIKDPESVSTFIDEKCPQLRGRLENLLALLMLTAKDIMLINNELLWDTISEIVKVISVDRPLIIHIEDLQWADPATLSLLTYIVRNTSTDRLLVIGTYRPEELTPTADGVPHPLNQTMDMLNKYRLCNGLTLERLSMKDTTDVINSAFPDAEFPKTLSEIIHRESG
ncbi:MAG: protein kinase, partial [candidate division WOR-3 bacterium]